MHLKTRIAVMIAALMLGAQAGVAAIDEAASIEPIETVGQPQAEATPVEPAAAPEATAQAEPVAPAVQTVAPAPSVAPAKPASWAGRFMGAIRSAKPVSVFPSGGDHYEPLPRQAEYLARLEQQRAHLVARGDVFPVGSVSETWLLPAQLAYFDRLERQRLASLQPQPAPQAEVQPGAMEAGAQPGTTELSMARDATAGIAQ